MSTSLRNNAQTTALHFVVRAALRLAPPNRAIGWVRHAAAWLPPFCGIEQARDARRILGQSGSCLTRAVTIASRLPGAEVVIGVDPWGAGSPRGHAWVEVSGVRLDPRDGEAFWFGEVARVRLRRDTFADTIEA